MRKRERPDLLSGYRSLQQAAPELFVNPPGAAFEILTDAQQQKLAEARVAALLREAGLPPESGGIGLLYRDQYLTLVRDAVRFRDGSVGGYLRILPSDDCVGAAVMPLVGQHVALVRHFRHATRRWHWEIPRGFGLAGETARQTARRELEEELKVRASELVRLGSLYPDTGLSSAKTELFLARADEIGTPEAIEGIDGVRLVAPGELERMIRDGTITDSFTLAAFAQARTRALI
jgi:ADP-ribose pyrophosphatase